jgi:parallel beta-helix repeat protein
LLLAGGAAALLGAGSLAAAAATLCVNSGGTGGCYKTITDAVGHANPGDTIRVAQGIYVEGDIRIGIPLSLLGANGANTIINATGKGNGVYVDGLDAKAPLSEVVVSGFTVENANFEGILVTNASAVTISDNRVTGNDVGLGFTPPCNGIPDFETEETFDCGEAIHLIGVDHSTVSDNLVENNAGGILLSDDTGITQHNLISGNSADNNPDDCGITLASHPLYSGAPTSVRGVDYNTISGNDSSGNGRAVAGAGAGVGLFVSGGGFETAGNVVIGNTLTGNGLPGVAFHLHTPNPAQNLNNNLIAGNTIAGNGADTGDAATPGPTGINVFTNPAAPPIIGTVIVDNVINKEAFDIVANNSGGVDAHLNNLLGKQIGVDNLGSGTVNATLNWWGCSKGPGAPGCASVAGSGVVSAPWLTSPAH